MKQLAVAMTVAFGIWAACFHLSPVMAMAAASPVILGSDQILFPGETLQFTLTSNVGANISTNNTITMYEGGEAESGEVASISAVATESATGTTVIFTIPYTLSLPLGTQIFFPGLSYNDTWVGVPIVSMHETLPNEAPLGQEKATIVTTTPYVGGEDIVLDIHSFGSSIDSPFLYSPPDSNLACTFTYGAHVVNATAVFEKYVIFGSNGSYNGISSYRVQLPTTGYDTLSGVTLQLSTVHWDSWSHIELSVSNPQFHASNDVVSPDIIGIFRLDDKYSASIAPLVLTVGPGGTTDELPEAPYAALLPATGLAALGVLAMQGKRRRAR